MVGSAVYLSFARLGAAVHHKKRPGGSDLRRVAFRGRFFLSLTACLPPLRLQEANWARRTQANVPSATGFQPLVPTDGEDPARKTTDTSLPSSLLAQPTSDMGVGGSVSKLLCGRFASTSPPTLITHKVATAITNQWRSARLGLVVLV